jgi:hypothetical protein
MTSAKACRASQRMCSTSCTVDTPAGQSGSGWIAHPVIGTTPNKHIASFLIIPAPDEVGGILDKRVGLEII